MPFPPYKKGALQTPDGAWIDYVSVGQGRPVLLIPGAGDGLQTVGQAPLSLAFTYRSYASRHRLVFASRRQPIPTGFTVRDMAKDYAWAIEQLGLGRTHVEANSAGGPVAQWLAVDRPDLVRSLVLEETLARADEPFRAVMGRWIAWADAGEWYPFLRDVMLLTGSPAFHRRWRWLYPLLRLVPKPRHPERLGRILTGLLEVDNRPILNGIGCPVLVIGGDLDQVTRLELQTEMARSIRGARQVILPGQGHYANVEAKEEHDRHVLGFFEEVEGNNG